MNIFYWYFCIPYSSLGEMTVKDGKRYSAWNKLREKGLTIEQAEKIKYIEKSKNLHQKHI